MTDDTKRRGIRTRFGTGASNPAGQVGQPNVLTGAATPNRLSSEVARPVNVSTVTQAPTTRLAATTTVRPGATPFDPDAPPTGRRAPTLQTLIVIGFLVLTGVRLAGQFLEGAGSDAPSATPPTATLAPAPGPGSVIFGTGLSQFCGVTDRADAFTAGTDVWWSAELSTVQEPDAEVVVIVRRGSVEVQRETVPPEPSAGKWLLLCAGEPVVEKALGAYRVEVWDADVTELQASGEYRLIAD